MQRLSVAQLFEENQARLALRWAGAPPASGVALVRDASDAPALVGHLNLIHPNRIQVLGAREAAHLASQGSPARQRLIAEILGPNPAAVVFAEDVAIDPEVLERANAAGVGVAASPRTSAQVIDRLRMYLAKMLADSTTLHGVFMDVLGLGVLITGESGVGKSELGLELISRGHGLVADDAVDISRIADATLEGRCPPLLKDYLEVRGLGLLDIRTIFGETAVRPKMKLKLVTELVKPNQAGAPPIERLPLHELTEDILGVQVRKVVIPVAAGRNLAVLLEAAVRNVILQLRGIRTTDAFIARQNAAMQKGSS